MYASYLGALNPGHQLYNDGYNDDYSHRYEIQGVTEFKMPTDVPSTLTQATLRFQVSNGVERDSTFEVFAYGGDGQVSTADWNSGTKVATIQLQTGQGAGELSVDVDVGVLNQVIGETGDWVGFNIREVSVPPLVTGTRQNEYNYLDIYGQDSGAQPSLDMVWMA